MRAKLRSVQVYRWRYFFVLVVLSAIGVALVVHLMSIQVLPEATRGFKFLQQQGVARTLRVETVPGLRGVITDRHGEALAISTPVISLWANPKMLSADHASFDKLATLVNVDKRVLQEKLSRYQEKEFMYLRRHMVPSDADKVLQLRVPGVYAQEEYRRFYPAGEVVSHLLGFTNIDDEGQEGLELAFDQWLSGKDGRKQVLKDLQGRVIKGVNLLQSAETGNNLALSIDMRLQYLAYRELKAAVKAHDAKAGSVVIMDVDTGEVLAMANQPSFNPNNRRGISIDSTRNRAMTDQFEPGSTMKPITIMAALEKGTVTKETEIDTNPGFYRVGKKTLLDPVNYGVMSLSKILQKSSQVGLTKISLEMEADEIRDMFFRLGLGQDTGTGFPGESTGLLPSHQVWRPIEQANFSFGYGLTTTPLQLAQAYTVIASHGEKKPVSLLKVDKEIISDSVVGKDVADTVADILKGVLEQGGTGTRAKLASYTASGKTGTIHKVGKSGYADDKYISLFAGFAPANDPKIVAVIVIDEPSKGQYFGGEVAAPVFSRVVDQGLRILQVPPSSMPIKQKIVKEGASLYKSRGPLS